MADTSVISNEDNLQELSGEKVTLVAGVKGK